MNGDESVHQFMIQQEDQDWLTQTLSFVELLYHFGIEAVVGQLSHEGQSAGTRLSHKVFFHSINSLKVVLQQPGQNTEINNTQH